MYTLTYKIKANHSTTGISFMPEYTIIYNSEDSDTEKVYGNKYDSEDTINNILFLKGINLSCVKIDNSISNLDIHPRNQIEISEELFNLIMPYFELFVYNEFYSYSKIIWDID